MVRCPRCQAVVDETSRSTCPSCGTPIAAPSAGTPQYAGAQSPPPGARVSLTGEVIMPETTVPTAAPGPYAPQPPVGLQAPPYPPSAVVRNPARSSTYRQQEAPKDRALLINLSVVFVLLLAAGGYGWYLWSHRTNPKSQVERYIHAAQWLDWGVVYDLSATPPAGKTRHDFINGLDEKYDYNGVLRIGARRANEQFHAQVADAQINGDQATVPAEITGPGMDQPRRLEFRLKNFGGVWKIYPPSDNPLDLFKDPEAEQKAEKAAKELLRTMQSRPNSGSNERESGQQ